MQYIHCIIPIAFTGKVKPFRVSKFIPCTCEFKLLDHPSKNPYNPCNNSVGTCNNRKSISTDKVEISFATKCVCHQLQVNWDKIRKHIYKRS